MSGTSSGYEWILLAVGGAMTLGLVVFFVIVLRQRDKE